METVRGSSKGGPNGQGTIGPPKLAAAQAEIDALRPHIGFERLDWQRPWLRLPEGMEIDFGGIGKEYAVDRALALAVARLDCAMLVNFGGDLAANRAPA